jgi:hypothetical protein
MATPVEVIESAIHAHERTPVEYTAVVQAIGQVTQAEAISAAGERVLVELLQPSTTITVSASELPHVQSPQDMIRSAAIYGLWRKTGTKHSALFRQVAKGDVSPVVKELVVFVGDKETASEG